MKEQGNLELAKEALSRGKDIFTGLNNQLGLKAIERAILEFQNGPIN